MPRSSPPPVEAGGPYSPRVQKSLPALDRAFRIVNRAVAIPLLHAGAGPLLANPLTGSLMVLRTRGRRSGAWREAPLGYVIRDGCVYCCAGFGSRTNWLRNLMADPRVEVLLPGRTFAGTAELVTEPSEQVSLMRQLMVSMRLVSRPLLGDLSGLSDDEVLSVAAHIPLVRIRATGLAPGPWDPGGRGWILVTAAAAIAALAWRRSTRAT